MTIDLSRFCAPASDTSRAHFRTPFALAGRGIATNGFVVLIVPADGLRANMDIDERFVSRLGEYIRFVERESDTDAPGWTPVESIELTDDKCHQCGGVCRVSVKDCADCDGQGEFQHGVHDYECQGCDGEGKVYLYDPNGPYCECCLGTGVYQRESDIRDPSGEWSASSVYVLLLRTLPKCRIRWAPDPDHATSGGMWVIRFDGGIGLLSPYRAL